MPDCLDITVESVLCQTGFNPTKCRLPDTITAYSLCIPPGPLDKQVFIVGRCGAPGNEIVIEGRHRGWIDADQRPDPRAERFDFILLHLKSCRHVILRNLCIANAWPTGILLSECEYITIENCRFRGGKEAIYAKNCRNLIVRGCHWQQDTSPGHDLWHRIDWVEAHGGEGGNDTFAYFNGAFLGGKALANVVVENNVISDAYNGIRLKADMDELGFLVNDNVIVAGNRFFRIRDNPIEPERYALNWHIRHNEIIDAHGWFSFDGVGGSHIYVYGNLGRFEIRQGVRTSPQHTMGRVLKLSYDSCNPTHAQGKETPDRPWYIFNNSFFLRCPLIGGAACSLDEPDRLGIGPDITRHLTFANNVFEWCDPDAFDDYTATWIELVRSFRQVRDDGVIFDGNLGNREDYFEKVASLYCWETNGICVHGRLFADGPAGDLTLPPDSPGLNSAIGLTIETPDGPFEVCPGDYGTHRGAWQSYGLTRMRPITTA